MNKAASPVVAGNGRSAAARPLPSTDAWLGDLVAIEYTSTLDGSFRDH